MTVPQLPRELWEKILWERAHAWIACHPLANRPPLEENACGCEQCRFVGEAAVDNYLALFDHVFFFLGFTDEQKSLRTDDE